MNNKILNIIKRPVLWLLILLMILSVVPSIPAAEVELEDSGAEIEILGTSANTVASDGSYRLYFKFSGGSTWWNNTNCYHYAWVWGTNMTSQWKKIMKVGTTSNASTGSTSDVFYMNIPSGTLTGMKLIRGSSSTSPSDGATTYGSPGKYNETGDLSISNNISTYNLVTAVTENSTSITLNSRYTTVSPSSYSATVTNAISGSGTEADPYIVENGQTMNISASSSIADHNFKVKYGYNSSSTYSDSTTGTITAGSNTSSSFRVYFTPALGGSTSYLGTQVSQKIYYTAQSTEQYTVTVTQSGGTGTVKIAGVTQTSYTDDVDTSYSLSITPPTNYYISALTIGGTSQSLTTAQRQSYSATRTLTADITIAVTYKIKPKLTYSVATASQGMGTVSGSVTSGSYVNYGSSHTLNAVPTNDYYKFSYWTVDGTTQSSTSTSLSVSNITANKTVVAYFTSATTYTITASSNSTTMGTVSVVGVDGDETYTLEENSSGVPIIFENGSFKVVAVANIGYRVKNWIVNGTTTGSLQNTYSVTAATKNYTIQAVFEELPKYTVTVSSNDTAKGTAATSKATVYQGESVVLTATTKSGYYFTGWTYTMGSNSYTSTSASLTISNVTGNIVAKANFAETPNVKIHYYSASDEYQYLYSYQTNSSSAKSNITDASPGTLYSTSSFRGTTWRTTGKKTLSTSYTNGLYVQLTNGKTQLATTSGSNKLVLFNNTLGWSNVYCYTSANNMWNGDNGVTTNGATRTNMTQISGTNYWYAYVPNTTYILFIKDQQDNYDNIYNTAASYKDHQTTYSSSYPMYSPGSTLTETRNGTSYYSSGSWGAQPTIGKSTAVKLVDGYFVNGTWSGEADVWVYYNGSTTTVTFRYELDKLITSTTETYSAGNANYKWTTDSWNAFKTAYDNAMTQFKSRTANQTNIDDAYEALENAYENLELNRSYTVTIIQTGGTAYVNSNVYVAPVEVPGSSQCTVEIHAPVGYHITSISGVDITTTNFTDITSFSFAVNDDVTIKVTYGTAGYAGVKYIYFDGSTFNPGTNRIAAKFSNGTNEYFVTAQKFSASDDLYYVAVPGDATYNKVAFCLMNSTKNTPQGITKTSSLVTLPAQSENLKIKYKTTSSYTTSNGVMSYNSGSWTTVE